MMRALQKSLSPIKRKLGQIVSRGVLTLVNDALKMQECQVTIMADETLDGVERFQQYGFSSVPLVGAETINLSVGGNRGHSVNICVDDRRYRIKGMADGAVAIYTNEDNNAQQHSIVLSSGRLVDVYCDKMTINADTSLTINTPLMTATAAQVTVNAATNVLIDTPEITIPNGDVLAKTISLVDHIHPGDSGGDTGKPKA